MITPLASSPSEPEIQAETGRDDRVSVIPSAGSAEPDVVRLSSLTTTSPPWPSLGVPLSAILETSPRAAGNMGIGSRPSMEGRRSIETPPPPSLAWGSKVVYGGLAARGPPAAAASPSLTSVRRGIVRVAPQLQAMLHQTRTSTELVMVMSAISLEAEKVWEARQRLRKSINVTAVEKQWQQGSDRGSGGSTSAVSNLSWHSACAAVEKQRATTAARSASLLQHVATLLELFRLAPGGQPDGEAVTALLSELKAARIQRAGVDEGLLALSTASPAAATPTLLGHLESWQALQHSRGGFESFSNHSANVTAEAPAAAAAGVMPLLEEIAALQQQQDEPRADKYPIGLGAAAPPPMYAPRPPPLLPLEMPAVTHTARRRAQALVDEEQWKTTSRLFA